MFFAMNKPDRLEVWLGPTLMLAADSSFAPDEGELINIRKATYRVVGRSFTIDHADDLRERQVRCNIIVELFSGDSEDDSGARSAAASVPRRIRKDRAVDACRRGVHSDPDNSGMCIYCAVILDAEPGEDPNHYRRDNGWPDVPVERV